MKTSTRQMTKERIGADYFGASLSRSPELGEAVQPDGRAL